MLRPKRGAVSRCKMGALAIALFQLVGLPSEGDARTVRLPVSELRCIADHATIYIGADGEPIYIYPGSCPKVIEDLSQIDIPARNSSTVRIPLNGRIVGLTRRELSCLVGAYKKLNTRTLKPQSEVSINLSNCPRK